MKTIRYFFILTVLCLATCGLQAQQQVTLAEAKNADMLMERFRGSLRFVGSSEKIDKKTLSQMFDESTYALYRKAHNEHAAAIPFWCVSGTCLTLSVVSLGMGAYGYYIWNHDPKLIVNEHAIVPPYPFFLIFGGIALTAAAVTYISAHLLTADSRRKLDDIAGSYNRNKTGVSLNVGISPSGVGLVLNF